MACRGRQLIRQQRKSLPIASGLSAELLDVFDTFWDLSSGSRILLFVVGSVEKRLVEEVRNNDTLIIVGETGSGKTTRKSVSVSPFSQLLF